MTRDKLLSFTFSEDNHVKMFYIQDKVDILLNSLEEQIQGLQSLLDFKQQEISVLESKVEELVIKNSEAYRQGADDVYLLLTGKKVNE